MSTSVTDVSAFTTPVTIPADGDTRNAASVNAAFQAISDRARFLLNASVGQLLWNARIRVAAVTTGIGVYVGAVESLLIGTSRGLSFAASEMSVTNEPAITVVGRPYAPGYVTVGYSEGFAHTRFVLGTVDSENED